MLALIVKGNLRQACEYANRHDVYAYYGRLIFPQSDSSMLYAPDGDLEKIVKWFCSSTSKLVRGAFPVGSLLLYTYHRDDAPREFRP